MDADRQENKDHVSSKTDQDFVGRDTMVYNIDDTFLPAIYSKPTGKKTFFLFSFGKQRESERERERDRESERERERVLLWGFFPFLKIP